MEYINKEEAKQELRIHFADIDYPEEVYERFANFIIQQNQFYYHRFHKKQRENAYHFKEPYMPDGYSINMFLDLYESLYDFLVCEGYVEEQIVESLKILPTLYRRSTFDKNIPLYEALGVKDDVLIHHPDKLRINVEQLHARKMCMLSLGKDVDNSCLLEHRYANFQRRCNVTLSKEELMEKYPLTKEARQVFAYLRHKNDDEIQQIFHLSRKQVLQCYPTTLDELKGIQRVGCYDEEKFFERYGITRAQALTKYPLNSETLRSLLFIRSIPSEASCVVFGKDKEELLQQKNISVREIRQKYKESKDLEMAYQKRKI